MRSRLETKGPSPTLQPPLVAVTMGEPAGVGPDLCVALARLPLPARVMVVGNCDVLLERARLMATPLTCVAFEPSRTRSAEPGVLSVLQVPLARVPIAGKPDPANSRAVLAMLEIAADGCMDGTFDAMATAPVHKAAINDAGVPFTGHTEFLAERTGTSRVVMMLVGGGMRVALATTHLALKDVARSITRETLGAVLEVVHRDLIARFAIARPRILVAGLNPHAGESGHLGREEIEVIAPVLNLMRTRGMDVVGPLPADTLFHPQRLRDADCVLAMYHDQGLPVLKYASFGHGVNVTLGLPLVRTSVDHGTALDLAGSGRADVGSLVEAIKLAAALAAPAKSRAPERQIERPGRPP